MYETGKKMIKKGLVYGGIMLGLTTPAFGCGFRNAAETTQNTEISKQYSSETLVDKCSSEIQFENKDSQYIVSNGNDGFSGDVASQTIQNTERLKRNRLKRRKRRLRRISSDYFIGAVYMAKYLKNSLVFNHHSITIKQNESKSNDKKDLECIDSILNGFSSKNSKNKADEIYNLANKALYKNSHKSIFRMLESNAHIYCSLDNITKRTHEYDSKINEIDRKIKNQSLDIYAHLILLSHYNDNAKVMDTVVLKKLKSECDFEYSIGKSSEFKKELIKKVNEYAPRYGLSSNLLDESFSTTSLISKLTNFVSPYNEHTDRFSRYNREKSYRDAKKRHTENKNNFRKKVTAEVCNNDMPKSYKNDKLERALKIWR